MNVNTLEHTATRTLELNEIGVCNLTLDRQVPFDPYIENRDMGGFILIDRFTQPDSGCGSLAFRPPPRRQRALAGGRGRQGHARSRLNGQCPAAVWFTGLSGAGKSTIANIVERKLHAEGFHTYLLDGDNVRHGLNKDLGFTDADRVENIRRVAEVVRLMVDAGILVLVSFISPFRAERQLARDLLGQDEFVEVHVDAPLEVAEARDRKGLYAKARRGELVNFTGIDSPYEPPDHPEIRLDASGAVPAEANAELVIGYLRSAGLLVPPPPPPS